jgi:serralysin
MEVRKLIGLAMAALLCACGAGHDATVPAKAPAPASQFLATGIVAVDYRTVVQQLYIAYFGRPADTGGQASFESQLLALAAPTDIQSLEAAYGSSAGVRALVNSFSASTEAQALYSGPASTYITAVYKNVLGRAPDAEGLAFWVNEVDKGNLTRAKASLSIMAGALTNKSPQGLLDAKTVNNKVTVGTNFTLAVAAAARNGYAGDAAAARARAMLATVTSSTDLAAFQAAVTALVQSLACDPNAVPGVGSLPAC